MPLSIPPNLRLIQKAGAQFWRRFAVVGNNLTKGGAGNGSIYIGTDNGVLYKINNDYASWVAEATAIVGLPAITMVGNPSTDFRPLFGTADGQIEVLVGAWSATNSGVVTAIRDYAAYSAPGNFVPHVCVGDAGVILVQNVNLIAAASNWTLRASPTANNFIKIAAAVNSSGQYRGVGSGVNALYSFVAITDTEIVFSNNLQQADVWAFSNFPALTGGRKFLTAFFMNGAYYVLTDGIPPRVYKSTDFGASFQLVGALGSTNVQKFRFAAVSRELANNVVMFTTNETDSTGSTPGSGLTMAFSPEVGTSFLTPVLSALESVFPIPAKRDIFYNPTRQNFTIIGDGGVAYVSNSMLFDTTQGV